MKKILIAALAIVLTGLTIVLNVSASNYTEQQILNMVLNTSDSTLSVHVK